MSVIIRGVKMPTSCDNCWALDDYGDYPRCRITEERRGYNFQIREKRMDNCPLVPVPTHGRLIDADELVADIKGQTERLWTLDSVSERDYFIERNEKFRQAMLKAWRESLFAYLDTRPTIIEPEEGEL